MKEHNARFKAGEETWSRKVTPFYDHTMEEVAAILTSGLPAYDNTTVLLTELMKLTWRSLLRCALGVPLTPGVGLNRVAFLPSRTRASVEVVLPLPL